MSAGAAGCRRRGRPPGSGNELGTARGPPHGLVHHPVGNTPAGWDNIAARDIAGGHAPFRVTVRTDKFVPPIDIGLPVPRHGDVQ